MAIVTVDAALAGMQPPREFAKALTGTLVAGQPRSLFYLAGMPGAGVVPTPGIGGEVLTTLSGQIPFSNPVSGSTYLSRFQGVATQAGVLMLCDRLWQNSGIDVTSTSEQTFTSSAQIPARDADGTNTGNQVYAAVEVSTAATANTPTLTLKYTNTAGATSTGTNIVATTATAAAGAFFPIGLAAGDVGVQKAQSLTLSAQWTTAVIHVVLYRVLARLELPTGQVPNAIDSLTGGFVKMYNNTVPFLVFIPNTTTSANIMGHMIYSQG